MAAHAARRRTARAPKVLNVVDGELEKKRLNTPAPAVLVQLPPTSGKQSAVKDR